MPKVLDHLALTMSSIMGLWQLILIKHRFALHFMVFLIIKPIILSCNKVLSDGFIRPTKVSKWSTHICKTKNSDILSHNYFYYFSILANDLDSHYNSLTADEMVEKFINTANNIGKDIKAFIHNKFKRALLFIVLYYIKKTVLMKNILHFEILSLTLTVKMLIITLNNLINMKNFAN